jgi:hypothetical protein
MGIDDSMLPFFVLVKKPVRFPLQKKILASYWKELYNEPFDEKLIADKAQNKLF